MIIRRGGALVKLSWYYLLLIIMSGVSLQAQTITWTETQPAGDADNNWSVVAMSSDGSKLIAGAESGRLYISTNGGSNWTETQPAGAANKNWYTAAISSDGSKLIAGAESGRLYISTNGGSSWTETQPAGAVDKSWQTTAMSSDGSRLIAGVYVGRLYVSTNGGSSWTETQPAGATNKAWYTIDMSSDGSKQIAGVTGGRLYISTNGGSSWTETQPAGATDKDWYTAAMSSDGSKLIAGTAPGRLYVSTNGGSTWTETQPAGATNKSWYTTAMSSDGSKLIAGTTFDRLYVSANGGSSWTETRPAGDVSKFWISVAMSSDGGKLITGAYGGRLYLNNEPLPVQMTSLNATVTRTGAAISWSTVTETNCAGFAVERRTITYQQSQIANWTEVGYVPGNGTSNAPHEYSFTDETVAPGRYAYRLKQVDNDGSFEYFGNAEVEVAAAAKQLSLGNFPNPFNPTTEVEFTVPTEGRAVVKVYNMVGQVVATLFDGFAEPGRYYRASFDGMKFSSGVYMYSLETANGRLVKRMTMLK